MFAEFFLSVRMSSWHGKSIISTTGYFSCLMNLQVSMQWDPSVTSYTYPGSMNGGLKCDSNGQISKPFPDKPYCQKTPTNIGVINKMSGPLSFCQTVLPGNENMLIPTDISDSATLAVPGMDYWASTGESSSRMPRHGFHLSTTFSMVILAQDCGAPESLKATYQHQTIIRRNAPQSCFLNVGQ